jgi:RNase H-fold protein (predicted Holliday junction resolvase)
MLKKEINILAVNPGTKYLGLAAFQGSDLVYWGVKVLKGKWSREKMRSIERILLDLIGQHDVTVLTLKKPHSSRSSRNLNCLVAAVERLTKKKRLKVRLYSLNDLKNFLALGMKINKIEMAGMAVARYQFLIHQLEREKKNKHPYFTRMFEAIAAGVLAFNRMDR